jgi:hypothetical protein
MLEMNHHRHSKVEDEQFPRHSLVGLTHPNQATEKLLRLSSVPYFRTPLVI